MESVAPGEAQLTAEIEALRARFPRTQDLYREVCVLLFFRHGITPTANKLYQLVRKGSMSAPTDALNQFWLGLRERSRVTVEHADLPEELKVAAGEMVAAVWRSAQAISRDALAAIQAEASEAAEAAKVGQLQAEAARGEAVDELERTGAQLRGAEDQIGQLRQERAAAEATAAGLEARIEDLRRLAAENQARLDQVRDQHAADRDKLADRTRLAEQRFADMEKRALLDIDRERTAAAKLQKALESERAAHAVAAERLRTDHNSAMATIGQLREQVGGLQSMASAAGKERDDLRAEVQSLRAQFDAAGRQAAVDSAMASHLREQLERQTQVAGRKERPVDRARSADRSAQPRKGERQV
jgi:chromosome segregation ATPase